MKTFLRYSSIFLLLILLERKACGLNADSRSQSSINHDRGYEHPPIAPTVNMRAPGSLSRPRKPVDPSLPSTSPGLYGAATTKRQADSAFQPSGDADDEDELEKSSYANKRRRPSASVESTEADSMANSLPREEAPRHLTLTEIASRISHRARMESSSDTDITMLAAPILNSDCNRAEFSFIHSSSRDQTWTDGNIPEYEEWGLLDVSSLKATDLLTASRQHFSPSISGVRLKFTEAHFGKARVRSHKIEAGEEEDLDLSRFKERWMMSKRAHQLKDNEVEIYPLNL
jgi:hypothetical protein